MTDTQNPGTPPNADSHSAARGAPGALPAYAEKGTGDTLVLLLHGIGGDRTVWPWQMKSLAAAGYRVVAWDMPGYGASASIDPYTIRTLSESAAVLIQHLGAPKTVVVGHSMGGMVAQSLAAAHPGLVQGLILYGTSPAFGKPEGDWQREFLAARLAPLDAGKTMPELAASLVAAMLGEDADPAGVALAEASMGRVSPDVYRRSLAALVGFDERAALARIAVPTLLIVGERDGNAPPAVMSRMADKVNGAQYLCVPGAGHLTHMEQPARFDESMLTFLRQHFPALPVQEAAQSGGLTEGKPGAPGAAAAGSPASAPATSATKPTRPARRYSPPPITGEGYPLSADQAQLIALADELGRTRFAGRAAQYDRDATFPFENYDDLRDSGLLRLCVPREHGGHGADFATYCMVAATIGRHCGATALTFNMHACSQLWSGPLADDLEMTAAQRAQHNHGRALHYERVVDKGAIYAQPFSEGSAAAAGKAPFGTLATRAEGGWLISGRKIFASLSGAANYYGVLCTEDKPGASMRDTMYIAVPADASGVTISGDWDPLGMRGTVSRNLEFKNVHVADTEQLMPTGVYFQAASRWPHMFMTLSPTYMGIAQAAYDFTVAYLRGEVAGMPPVKRRMYPTKQIAVAEMRVRLEQTRALFLHTIHEARIDPPKDARLRLYSTQYTVMENANEICRLAIRTCGGQPMLKTLPLERLYRDSRCGSLMLPWTAELCLDRLGREALYESGETDE